MSAPGENGSRQSVFLFRVSDGSEYRVLADSATGRGPMARPGTPFSFFESPRRLVWKYFPLSGTIRNHEKPIVCDGAPPGGLRGEGPSVRRA
jgi:hypothetical protein